MMRRRDPKVARSPEWVQKYASALACLQGRLPLARRIMRLPLERVEQVMAISSQPIPMLFSVARWEESR
jgi:hypothetical protein